MWKGIGYGAVIYYAALMGIDAEYYEAARIDGAGKIRQAMSISVPMIMPIIVMLTILQIGKILYGDFGLFYNVTLNSSLLYPATDVIDTFVYRSLIDLGDFGMASAAGLFQSFVGFILVLATNFIVKKNNPDHSLF
ncbi:ABC transporter permease subunit [Cohnella faecalis]|uniref:ABC transporter permease subunit n=1 Tax=Cohnella faecalis TaxID=2315694 RepID=UPI001314C090|nr:ABC transporter permease subunit [Cohnella faecalis]